MPIRHGDWKLVLEEQREQQMKVWSEPLVSLRQAARKGRLLAGESRRSRKIDVIVAGSHDIP